MDNTLLQKIKDAIAKSNNIGIVVGQNPTLDQMAAALSLYLLLNQVNKKAVVASPTNPIVEISSLVGINKVQTSLGGDSGDLIVSFPYVEGEIEKVSYTLENEFLNIIVKAGEQGLSFDERDVKYIRGSGSVDLLFVVGTAKLADLGELANGDKLNSAKIINIDNQQDNQGFGDIVLVDKSASTVCEIIGDLVLNLGFHIDQDAAQNLMSGIVDATDNLQAPNTTALALEIASIAMKSGARRDDAAHKRAASFMPMQQQPMQQQPMPQQPMQQQQIQTPFGQEQQPIEEKFPEQPQRMQEETPREDKSAHRIQRLQEDLQQEKVAEEDKAPIDWLSPKVYKGSTNV
jgi:hypothetical protein